jgi:hypothetical protein
MASTAGPPSLALLPVRGGSSAVDDAALHTMKTQATVKPMRIVVFSRSRGLRGFDFAMPALTMRLRGSLSPVETQSSATQS